MPRKRCVIRKDGRTIASETAEASNGAVAENAALAKVNKEIDWDAEDDLVLDCGDV